MKPICLDLGECESLGDLICATPTIKKLYDSYGQKVTILSKIPELFKLNPFVEKSYKISSIDIGYFNKHYLMHNSFYNMGRKNERGVEYKYNTIDIRQIHAINLGFMLTQDEMDCYYRPLQDSKYNFEENYITIDPIAEGSKFWGKNNWVDLCEKIKSLGIKVVLLGQKRGEPFDIDNTINLIDKTNVSDCWHLIDKSLFFLTIDSGLLHLAGTTDTHIIQLATNIKPELRIPYRNGSQQYKHTFICGDCNIFCGSDTKYYVREWGNIQGVPPITKCLENKTTFECHPSVDKVFNVIKSLI